VPTPPFGNEIEWRIPLNAVISPSTPAFPNDSFDMLVYSTEGFGDVSQVIRYTLADAPAGTPGDFDLDSDVDGADFLLWQEGLGPEFDATDLADWRNNFGTGSAAVFATSIPEPTSLSLGAVLVGAAMWRRRI
jgi:hypothetical protein